MSRLSGCAGEEQRFEVVPGATQKMAVIRDCLAVYLTMFFVSSLSDEEKVSP